MDEEKKMAEEQKLKECYEMQPCQKKEKTWNEHEHYEALEKARDESYQSGYLYGYRTGWQEAYVNGYKDGFDGGIKADHDRLEYEEWRNSKYAVLKKLEED